MGRQGIGASLICVKIEQKTGRLDIQLGMRLAWSPRICRLLDDNAYGMVTRY